MLSKTIPGLDSGHGEWDHLAVGLETQWQETLTRPPQSARHSSSSDPVRITPDKVVSILQDYSPVSWNTDIESHVQHFNAHVLRGLRQACPRVAPGSEKDLH